MKKILPLFLFILAPAILFAENSVDVNGTAPDLDNVTFEFSYDLDNGSGKNVGTVYGKLSGDNLYIYVKPAPNGLVDAESVPSDGYIVLDETYIAENDAKDKFGAQGLKIPFSSFSFIGLNASGTSAVGWEGTIDLTEYVKPENGFTGNLNLEVHTNFSFNGVPGLGKGETGWTSDCFYGCNPPREVPIDGGLGILALAGLGFGLYKRRK